MIAGAIRAAAGGARMAGAIAGQTALTASKIVVSVALHVIESAAGGNTRTRQTKFKWDHVLQKYGEGRARALKIAGAEVRRGAQRSMSNRTPLKTPRLIYVGTVNGERLVAKRTQIARPDRVTSWKTAMFPKGFLRSDIRYDYDSASDSVVVGPAMAPRINKLHEVGGPVKLWFVRTSPPPRVPRRLSGGTVFGITSNRPAGRDPVPLGSRRVKARRYMEKGLKEAMPKIAPAWRDTIVGP